MRNERNMKLVRNITLDTKSAFDEFVGGASLSQ